VFTCTPQLLARPRSASAHADRLCPRHVTLDREVRSAPQGHPSGAKGIQWQTPPTTYPTLSPHSRETPRRVIFLCQPSEGTCGLGILLPQLTQIWRVLQLPRPAHLGLSGVTFAPPVVRRSTNMVHNSLHLVREQRSSTHALHNRTLDRPTNHEPLLFREGRISSTLTPHSPTTPGILNPA